MYVPCKLWDTYTKRNVFTSNLVLISYHFKLPVFKDIIFKSRLNTKYNLILLWFRRKLGLPIAGLQLTLVSQLITHIKHWKPLPPGLSSWTRLTGLITIIPQRETKDTKFPICSSKADFLAFSPHAISFHNPYLFFVISLLLFLFYLTL